jgi:hypothetical protein
MKGNFADWNMYRHEKYIHSISEAKKEGGGDKLVVLVEAAFLLPRPGRSIGPNFPGRECFHFFRVFFWAIDWTLDKFPPVYKGWRRAGNKKAGRREMGGGGGRWKGEGGYRMTRPAWRQMAMRAECDGKTYTKLGKKRQGHRCRRW